ncbi:MAG: hypothetical protein J0H89_11150, partial [Rhizobiales bacterium]|nr:hypothetical protein [Hyphomicrobiales bacterium]
VTVKASIVFACGVFGCLTFSCLTLVSNPALGQTPEEQQACVDDAFNICGHAIPDRNRVEVCLNQNISRVSGACRAVMQRYSKGSSRAGDGRAGRHRGDH